MPLLPACAPGAVCDVLWLLELRERMAQELGAEGMAVVAHLSKAFSGGRAWRGQGGALHDPAAPLGQLAIGQHAASWRECTALALWARRPSASFACPGCPSVPNKKPNKLFCQPLM